MKTTTVTMCHGRQQSEHTSFQLFLEMSIVHVLLQTYWQGVPDILYADDSTNYYSL